MIFSINFEHLLDFDEKVWSSFFYYLLLGKSFVVSIVNVESLFQRSMKHNSAEIQPKFNQSSSEKKIPRYDINMISGLQYQPTTFNKYLSLIYFYLDDCKNNIKFVACSVITQN